MLSGFLVVRNSCSLKVCAEMLQKPQKVEYEDYHVVQKLGFFLSFWFVIYSRFAFRVLASDSKF
jgi:hypothetical protein